MDHFLKIPDIPDRERNFYAVFRAAIADRGTLKIATGGFYRLFFRGEPVGYGPSRSAAPLGFYDEYELSGAGTIAVLLHSPRKIPELAAEFSGGELDWKARYMTAYREDAPYMVGDAGFSEYYDCSAGEDVFFQEEYDDRHWSQAVPGSPDSGTIQKSPLPHFPEQKKKPVSLQRLPDGAVLADFGSMVFGRVCLSGNAHGELEMAYFEDLQHGWVTDPHHHGMYADRLFSLTGAFQYKTFRKRGFRYLLLRSAPDFSMDTLAVAEAPYPVNFSGAFRSSDPRLNRLFEISARTLALCMDDIYNDCPHRDQGQWMDSFVSAQTAFYLTGDTILARKAILQHALCSFRNGRFLSPSITGKDFFIDYALILIRFLHWYCQVSKDTAILREILPNCETAMTEFRQWQDPADGLLKDLQSHGTLYLDNAFELCRIGKSAGVNALYYTALDTMGELETMNGADPAPWKTEAARIQAAFTRTFVQKDHSVCDSDSLVRRSFHHLNFSCELGEMWQTVDWAKVTFHVPFARAEKRKVLAGAYGPFRMLVNGVCVLEDRRTESWARPAPCYDPLEKEIFFAAGENEIAFEVACNGINWELFFAGFEPGTGELVRFSHGTGTVLSKKQPVRPKYWEPPILSQTTAAYAVFSGLAGRAALEKTVTQADYRDYLSVRIPRFSTITDDPAKLKNWILPVNTPWTGFYYVSSLFQCGMAEEALAFLRKAWGVMLSSGAVNTWEEWNWNASLCHAWGASPAYFLLHDILGIRLEDRAGKIIRIRPNLLDLEYAEGTAALSATESVTVSARRTAGGKLEIHCQAPDGWKIREEK